MKVGSKRRSVALVGSVMELEAILALAATVSSKHFGGRIHPVMLCSLAIMESCGRDDLRELNDEKNEPALGLLQLCYSTCLWLHGTLGYAAFPLESREALLLPEVNLYFGAAFLAHLQQLYQPRSSEERLVRSFTGGLYGYKQQATLPYWEHYKVVQEKVQRVYQAQRQLRRNSDLVMHVVKKGQSLKYLARASGVSPDEVVRANPDIQGVTLRAGDCIALPARRTGPLLHVVQGGQTLWAISQEYEVGLGRLLRGNPDLADTKRLAPGSLVHIPGVTSDSLSSMSSAASYQRTLVATLHGAAALAGSTWHDLMHTAPDVSFIETPELNLDSDLQDSEPDDVAGPSQLLCQLPSPRLLTGGERCGHQPGPEAQSSITPRCLEMC